MADLRPNTFPLHGYYIGPPPPPPSHLPRNAHCVRYFLTGTPMMRCTGATATTTTATGCEWSFPAAAAAREAASAGSAGRPGADTGLHPDAQSTGSLCRVSMTIGQSSNKQAGFIYLVAGFCSLSFFPFTKSLKKVNRFTVYELQTGLMFHSFEQTSR